MEKVYEALHKIGLPALEPTLEFLKEQRTQKDDGGILGAIVILKGIKDEKTFIALIDLLHDDAVEKEYIIPDLVQYGDGRTAEHLRTLVSDNEDESERLDVFEAIRDLAPTETQAYHDMIAPYSVKDLSKLSAPIHRALGNLTLAHKHNLEFEGDNAKEFNSVVFSYRIQEAMADLLRAAFELGSYETILPNHLNSSGELLEIRTKWYNLKQENVEIIEMINTPFPEDCLSQVTKSYNGLATSRYESGPKNCSAARQNPAMAKRTRLLSH